MNKKVIIDGNELYEVKQNENTEICTIENTDKDEYYVFNKEGEGISIIKLNSIDIIELLATGSIDRDYMTIYPYTK